MLQAIISALFSQESLAIAIPVLFGFIVKVAASVVRKKNVGQAVFHAFHIVEDLADDVTDEGKLDKGLDKAKEGLKAADDWCKVNGWRPLKPWEQDKALLTFKSLNGQALVAASVAPSPQ